MRIPSKMNYIMNLIMKHQKFKWHKEYPVGVPYEIDPGRYASLAHLLEECVNKYGPLPAFDSMGSTITYDKLDMLTRDFAAYLQHELRLRKGSRIAIQLPNILQYPIAIFGALRAGMVVVNANPYISPKEMKHQFTDSGVDAIVTLNEYAPVLEKILPDTSISHIIITEIDDQLSWFKRFAINNVTKHFKKKKANYNLPKAIRFNDTLKQGSKHVLKDISLKAEDVAFIQYANETMGMPKGAVLTHYNLLANVEQLSAWLSVRLIDGEETVITPLPLYQINTLTINCLTMLKMGARNILISHSQDTKAILRSFKKYRISIIAGNNRFYKNLLANPKIRRSELIALRLAIMVGPALNSEIAEEWKNRTNILITEGYESKENATLLAFNIPQIGNNRGGAIGLPIPSTEIIIADNEEKELPAGIPGKIFARGPQIIAQYWNRPDETNRAFTKEGSWFKTGNIGVMEANGFVRVIDHKKETELESEDGIFRMENA